MQNNDISIIVPTLNEEDSVSDLIANLESFTALAEVLIVDGGSTDKTVALLQPHFRVIETQAGRAHQLNFGAEYSRGNVFLFLHADSRLPDNAISEINRLMKDYNWGCFGIRFDSIRPLMKICSFISNNRVRGSRKVVFGDQGIFIKRELFNKIGGFPDIPIMEDYQFSLTLKELGEPIGFASKRITTSDRRFRQGGRLRMMWKMNRWRAAYRAGVSPDVIYKEYGEVR